MLKKYITIYKQPIFPHNTFFNRGLYSQQHQRPYAKISAGTIKEPIDKILPSTIYNDPQQIQSDTSGHHKVVVTQTCSEAQCHNRECNISHASVCPQKTTVAELGGTVTHKIPFDKKGVLLDSHDFKGEPKSQYMVTEKTVVPIDINNFKEHPKATEFVQQESIAKTIRDNMPDNSVLALKNTSINKTPFDENL